MLFQNLGLIEPLLKALDNEGYTMPTPIQQQAIPVVLQSRDLLGCAQTGTGKTAAFSLPILQTLYAQRDRRAASRCVKTLILTPTRELAIQINESIAAYGRHVGLRHTVIFGGVGQEPQVQALHKGLDILTATPGRLLDLMNQGHISLKQVGIFVLDEADRMLDMGFIHDVKKVIAQLPTERQTLFFSATMPPEIAQLANSILRDPVRVEVTPVSSTAEKVAQTIFFTEKKDKRYLLEHLLKRSEVKSALVFTRTKHGANRVASDLTKAGIYADAIHGNKSQSARQTALYNFKTGKSKVLVATDIAARGIDIEELSHVINFDLPNIPETYVHRIGRTGRAGASGEAWSLCEAEEVPYLKDIQKLIGQTVPVERDHPFAAPLDAPTLAPSGNKSSAQQVGKGNAPKGQPNQPNPTQTPRPERNNGGNEHGQQRNNNQQGQQPNPNKTQAPAPRPERGHEGNERGPQRPTQVPAPRPERGNEGNERGPQRPNQQGQQPKQNKTQTPAPRPERGNESTERSQQRPNNAEKGSSQSRPDRGTIHKNGVSETPTAQQPIKSNGSNTPAMNGQGERPKQNPPAPQKQGNQPKNKQKSKDQWERHIPTPKPVPKRPEQRRTETEKTSESVMSFMKNRFASIVEASTLMEPLPKRPSKPKSSFDKEERRNKKG